MLGMVFVDILWVFKNWMKSTGLQSKRSLSVRPKLKNTGDVISVYSSNFTVNDGFPVGKAEIHSNESQERSYRDNSSTSTNRARTATAANTSFI